jgi:hypothetical protein
LFILLGIIVFLFITIDSARSAALDRSDDPVVMTGADLPWCQGWEPDEIVAFRYDGGWLQIPVQVDERDWRDLATIYDTTALGIVFPVYTDTSTFTGPDSNAAFDEDDELVFMARDAGDVPAVFSEPSGIVSGSGVAVAVTDSLNGGTGTVYLFQNGGSLQPDADTAYVDYRFQLFSGDYRSTYHKWVGPNPESSFVVTPNYRHRFSDRWIEDEINIYRGAATGVDIFDRHKLRFEPGQCGRTEDTFSNGEGCFIANKPGPVRGLRSLLGCNSGPWTQRDHFAYDTRHDLVTYLRVHSIGVITDYFDYSPAAENLTYHNDLNPAGVTIDGYHDTVALGDLEWEMVRGEQGGLIMVIGVDSDIPDLTGESYYLDDINPSIDMCTGDDHSYGASGMQYTPIPNTDPSIGGDVYYFIGTRTIFYEPPDITVTDAESRRAEVETPLTFTAAQYLEPVPPEVTLHISREDVILIWMHLEPNLEYEVWRDSISSFNPDLGEGQLVTTEPALPGSMSYVDPGRTGDPEKNYYYILRGKIGTQKSTGSQPAGEFDRQLAHGK